MCRLTDAGAAALAVAWRFRLDETPDEVLKPSPDTHGSR
jgi:hypothetical protein